MNYSIKNDYYEITVASLGAELCSVKAASGKELMWQNETNSWNGHAPLLFPVCGKLKDAKYCYCGKEYPMSGHGFAKKSEFELISAEGSHITMKLCSNEETKKIYPFDFTVIADYELRDEEIIFSFTVNNDGDCELPYMFGWHPGFNLPAGVGRDINDYKLYFGDYEKLDWHPLQNGVFACPEGRDYPLDGGAYRLNEKEIYENDTMIFFGHGNKLVMSADSYPYSLTMSWSDNLPALCIWKAPCNEARYICLEPWSGIPADGVADEDFETRKMERLAAGNSEKYSYSLKFTV